MFVLFYLFDFWLKVKFHSRRHLDGSGENIRNASFDINLLRILLVRQVPVPVEKLMKICKTDIRAATSSRIT